VITDYSVQVLPAGNNCCDSMGGWADLNKQLLCKLDVRCSKVYTALKKEPLLHWPDYRRDSRNSGQCEPEV
jgi:hypothetical protein